jgi:hypothetical protein
MTTGAFSLCLPISGVRDRFAEQDAEKGTAMRKVILMMSVSLDGFIEGPNRELDWHMVDDELHRHFNEQLAETRTFGNDVVLLRYRRSDA